MLPLFNLIAAELGVTDGVRLGKLIRAPALQKFPR